MHFEEIQRFLDQIPYKAEMKETSTVPERGRVLYEHIRRYKPLRVLELGVGFGVGSCYIAAALHENQAGYLTSVDLIDASYSPSAEELLSQAKLDSYVSICREKSSYTWFLKKQIEQHTGPDGVCVPEFDMCFIDGSKDWTIEGAAFFMVDKLMKEGGWFIFDDYDWIRNANSLNERSNYDGKILDEDSQPHVEAVFRLLVTQHPNYGEFQVDGNRWAWARKVYSETRTIRLTYSPSFRYTVAKRMRSFHQGLKSLALSNQKNRLK
jgi:predicted O-methyltransferase YrrM